MESAQVILKHGIEQVKAVRKNEANENTITSSMPKFKNTKKECCIGSAVKSYTVNTLGC